MKKTILVLLVIATLSVAQDDATTVESTIIDTPATIENQSSKGSVVGDLAEGATDVASGAAKGVTYAVVGVAGVIAYTGLAIITLPMRLFE